MVLSGSREFRTEYTSRSVISMLSIFNSGSGKESGLVNGMLLDLKKVLKRVALLTSEEAETSFNTTVLGSLMIFLLNECSQKL